MSAGELATGVIDHKIAVDAANTEYSQLLVPDTDDAYVKQIEIQCRDGTDILCSFSEGAVDGSAPSGAYFTVKSGTVYRVSNLHLNKATLYVAAGVGSKVVEVRVWKR